MPDRMMSEVESRLVARAEAKASRVFFAFGPEEYEAADAMVEAGMAQVKAYRGSDDFGYELTEA